MNLLERSARLAAEVGDLNARKEMADQVQAVAARRTTFSQVGAEILVGSAKRTALKRHDVPVEAMSTAALSGKIEAWRNEVRANPAAVLAPGSVATQILGPLKIVAKTLVDTSAQAWSEHVRSRVPHPAPDALSVRERLPGGKEKVSVFRDLQSRALALADTVPVNDAEFDRFESRAAACRQAWADIEGQPLPDEVRRFLQAASQTAGAPLQLLLEGETLAWIQDQGLVDHFRIRGA